ncbi:hypothetical protein TIFTF001_042705 [Ficus carica]|uniref:Retrotransposon gag domain-containing protein n=1 Tax=Ficus carica TaxID=3494 RepID=A0AA88A2B3_FICCA|nr:hypothetical protein TIFTF001_042705 [Ficus carica]
MEVSLPDKFRAPQISLYKGRTDPDDHLELYIGHMVLHGYSEEIMCRASRNTLSRATWRWFTKLQPNFITSWKDVKRAFSNQFLGIKIFATPKQNLTIMFQGPQESLKEWLTRFNVEVVSTEEISNKDALMGTMSSMRPDIPFRDDLHQKPAKTYREFLERMQGFIKAEEAKILALKSKLVVPKSTSNVICVDQSSRRQNGKEIRGSGNSESTQYIEN